MNSSELSLRIWRWRSEHSSKRYGDKGLRLAMEEADQIMATADAMIKALNEKADASEQDCAALGGCLFCGCQNKAN